MEDRRCKTGQENVEYEKGIMIVVVGSWAASGFLSGVITSLLNGPHCFSQQMKLTIDYEAKGDIHVRNTDFIFTFRYHIKLLAMFYKTKTISLISEKNSPRTCFCNFTVIVEYCHWI